MRRTSKVNVERFAHLRLGVWRITVGMLAAAAYLGMSACDSMSSVHHADRSAVSMEPEMPTDPIHEIADQIADRPNIVLIITDDQGYGDFSCHGNPVIKTPHLDALHDQSIRLTNFHVGPTCAPTRAGLLTGRYSGSTGVWHTIGGRSIVRQREHMLPGALQAAGYRTGMFGKWHLGDNYPYRPHDRGFELAIWHPAGGIGQQPDHWGNDYFDDTYLVNDEPTAFTGYCTDVWFDEATRFIDDHLTAHPDRPFFCYLAPNAPHSPYNVPDAYAAPYRGEVGESAARFYGMITHLDERVGQLKSHLEDLGQLDETIFIFMTDNGSSMAMLEAGGFPREGFNAGLRGGKGSAFDGGHRVPVFVHWPEGGLAGPDAGRDINNLTANIDLMPTLLDLCRVPAPAGYESHGTSMRPLLETSSENAAPSNTEWPQRSVVTESQRVPEPIKWRQSCVMTDRWRLIEGSALYDMQTDRVQRHDVAAEHPEVVERLRRDYEAWWDLVYADAATPIPLPIGDPDGPEVVQLNSHDWRYPEAQGNVPWQQGQIRNGMTGVGYWEIEVRTAGAYQIELRRWPKEAGHALTAGVEGDDIPWNATETDPGFHHWYTGGEAVPIERGIITIADQRLVGDVAPDESSITFTIELPEGLTTLDARFETADGESFGAYYVYVTKE